MGTFDGDYPGRPGLTRTYPYRLTRAFLRHPKESQSKLGTKLREKGDRGRDRGNLPTNRTLPFSPMLVNCCAGSRNSTHIGRRSLPSASQQLDDTSMSDEKDTDETTEEEKFGDQYKRDQKIKKCSECETVLTGAPHRGKLWCSECEELRVVGDD